MDAAGRALIGLGNARMDHGYEFVTVTPEAHRRVLERDARPARDLRDVFGWSRPFERALLPDSILRWACDADVLRGDGALVRSTVRFSSSAAALCAHSAFPTLGTDATFFGPDTYRFAAFVARSLQPC